METVNRFPAIPAMDGALGKPGHLQVLRNAASAQFVVRQEHAEAPEKNSF